MNRSYRSDQELELMVLDLVHRARQECGILEGHTGEQACQAIGLRLARRRLPDLTDGLLHEDEVVISMALQHAPRVQYTIFHEIMHYLLERDGELYEYLTDVLADDPRTFDTVIERWCQLGAAEFLLPRQTVRSVITDMGFSVQVVEKVAELTGASVVASSIQVATCAPVDCYVVVCRYGPSPQWPHQPTLFVEQATRRLGSQFPIARGTTIPNDHLFRAAWDSGVPQSGKTVIPFRSGKSYPCSHAEACRLGNQVIGVLYKGSPPRIGQLSLEI